MGQIPHAWDPCCSGRIDHTVGWQWLARRNTESILLKTSKGNQGMVSTGVEDKGVKRECTLAALGGHGFYLPSLCFKPVSCTPAL